MTCRPGGRAAAATALLCSCVAVSCGCSKRAAGSVMASTSASLSDPADAAARRPMDPEEAAAWARAATGEDEDRMRLADRIGCDGLREGADDPALRTTAIRAMAYCRDFAELPWLAAVGASADRAGAVAAAQAIDALDAIIEQAARRRSAADPEDAAELAEGCQTLLAVSRAPKQPRERRVRAVRALRMLRDRGCVKSADIPTDLDAR